MSISSKKPMTDTGAEVVLKQDAELFHALIENSLDGIVLYDVCGMITYASPSMKCITGYTPEEFVGLNAFSLIHTDDLELVRNAINSINDLAGKSVTFQCRLRCKDESWRWMEGTGTNLRDDSRVGKLVGYFHDITERKRAEQERDALFHQLQETKEQAQFLAEVGKVFTSTLDYQTTLANIAQLVVPRLADWFVVDLMNAQGGFELIEVDHKDPEKVIWAKELRKKFPVDPHAPTGVPNVVRTGTAEIYPEITDEMLIASARNEEELAISRQIGFTSAMVVPLVARGKTLGAVTFVSTEAGRKYNATDLALAEEVGRRAGVALDNALLYRQVRESRDQLNVIFQGVADGIIVYNKNSQIIYANDAAAAMTGFASVHAMMETHPHAIVAEYEITDEHGHPFPLARLPHMRVFAGEYDAQAIIGYHYKTAQHSEHWSVVTSRPVFDEQGHILFAITILHNITERMLEERRKDEFISMASHELKTPVTSLKGFTNILQRRLTKQGDAAGLHYLARMDTQLNKLTKLITDLLDISRMQTSTLIFQKEPVDLDTFVHEALENLQAATSTHRLLLEGRADAQIMGDKDRLGQVIINLVTNAIKYSPRADKVIIRLSQDQKQAIISVQDFGIGIAEAHHQQIFERFYQVTNPEEKTYPGLGIGLYISREIVERHHGRVWVKSRKGEGATFYVALPLAKDE